jgi:glycosyltransferase involved in cell wall biosynthesis
MDCYPNQRQRTSRLREGGSSPRICEDLASETSSPEVSVVMPCLNEADTLETCLTKAQRALCEHKIAGEIIVADNGSTDGSQAIATRMGARVVHVESKGYGNALMGGIAAAHGNYVIMGDADDSYDFLEIPLFVEKLRAGFDLVQGCRLPSGGGKVLPGAMPLLHRWWGNPMFSSMTRRMFSAPIHDVYCGMRGFTKEFYERLNPRCTGMEFATEMIIKASLYGERIAEVPITLHPDGRKSHAPHLKTFRDGWRTLRFFLMYSPRWLFLIPGVLLVLLGLVGYGVAMPGLRFMGVAFDAHTLLFSSLAILCGYQSILFAIFTKTFAIAEGLMPEDRRMTRFFKIINLERGLSIAFAALLIGVALLLSAVNQWRLANFGSLDYAHTMRLVVPGVTLTALGFQTILSSFFASILGMHRR